jgi:hypothetical protein
MTSSALAEPREVMALMTGWQLLWQAPLLMLKSSTWALAVVWALCEATAMPAR